MRTARSFFVIAVLALGVLATNASAQSSLIYWRNINAFPNPSNHYKYPVRATSAQIQTLPSDSGNPSALSTYFGGRQFFVDYKLDPSLFGFVPGTNIPRSVLLLISEQPTAPAVTVTFGAFANGPEFLANAQPRWASNNSDSFLSFEAINTTLNQKRVYRFNGPISSLFSPTFVPFSPADVSTPAPLPADRLRRFILPSVNSFTNDWNSTGATLMFSTPAPFGFRTSTLTGGVTTVANDPAVSGFTLIDPVFSPVIPNLAFAVAQTPGGARGLAAFNVVTKAFVWILMEGGVGVNRISDFKGPQVSPDGERLAFTLSRMAKIGTQTGPAPTLATISIRGGAPTYLWTKGLSPNQNFEPTGWFPAP